MEGIHLHVVGLSPKFGWSSPSPARRNGLYGRRKLELNLPSLEVTPKRGASVGMGSAEEQKGHRPDWVVEFLGDVGSSSYELAEKKRREGSALLEDLKGMDWCVRARKSALRTIEQKGLMHRVKDMMEKKKKKKKKNNKKNKDKSKKLWDDDVSDDEFDGPRAEEIDVESIGELSQRVSMMGGGMFEEKKEKTKGAYMEKLSQFAQMSGPSDRKKEIGLNKAITDAQTADEVVEVVEEMMSAVAKGLKPSPLTPLNIATALHRIAKNMEKVSMMETGRFAFARQQEMSMLVGIAMVTLPKCSAQGISNIAWALSKIGGEILYLSEMDRIGEVAITKVGEFNAQNVANVAGAFASMKHSSPALFSRLSKRASESVDTFRGQELAQLLWAFASLNEPADELLDALDNAIKDYVVPSSSSLEENLSSLEDIEEDEISDKIENIEENLSAFEDIEEDEISDEVKKIEDLEVDSASVPAIPDFSRDQLGNIAWSLAALGKLDRPFFSYVWTTLSALEMQKLSEPYGGNAHFVAQVILVNQCLKLEQPHLGLSLNANLEEKLSRVGRTKRFDQKKTSAFQKEVARLLISTGLPWVREYTVDGYTLDLVLVDRKLALEIDGPTHFSRNLGIPLGHTVLKRRYITAVGWKMVSLSFMEWEELQGEFEQLEYLRRILGTYLSDDSFEKAAAISEQSG